MKGARLAQMAPLDDVAWIHDPEAAEWMDRFPHGEAFYALLDGAVADPCGDIQRPLGKCNIGSVAWAFRSGADASSEPRAPTLTHREAALAAAELALDKADEENNPDAIYGAVGTPFDSPPPVLIVLSGSPSLALKHSWEALESSGPPARVVESKKPSERMLATFAEPDGLVLHPLVHTAPERGDALRAVLPPHQYDYVRKGQWVEARRHCEMLSLARAMRDFDVSDANDPFEPPHHLVCGVFSSYNCCDMCAAATFGTLVTDPRFASVTVVSQCRWNMYMPRELWNTGFIPDAPYALRPIFAESDSPESVVPTTHNDITLLDPDRDPVVARLLMFLGHPSDPSHPPPVSSTLMRHLSATLGPQDAIAPSFEYLFEPDESRPLSTLQTSPSSPLSASFASLPDVSLESDRPSSLADFRALSQPSLGIIIGADDSPCDGHGLGWTTTSSTTCGCGAC